MKAHVAASTLCFVIIGYINVAVCEGPWCYVCDKAVKPGFCGDIFKCSDDEQCYASSTGVSPTQYTAGCRKKQLCQGTGSVAGGSTPHGCEECCFGDHCNSDLCGGLPVPKGGNRLCLQCEAVGHLSECTAVSKCGQDKYCSIWKRTRFFLTFYDLGCLDKSQCDGHMKGVDHLSHGGFICCNDDLCNSHENNDHLTPAPTSPTTTTSLPTTTLRTGNIKCKLCPIVQQPSSCEDETECGPDQYCSVRKFFQLGVTFYDLGCEEKTECAGHMTTLGEAGIRCCNEDLCNADLNPVNGTTTPAATAPATPETSTSTAKTSSLPTTTIRTGNLKCKNCEIVQQPSFCQTETYCGPDQYCSVKRIFQMGMTFYDLGCEEKTECVGQMTTLGEDGIRCCNEDLCNADVNPVTGTTTPAATAPATPESSTSTTNSSPLPTMAPHILNTNQTVNAILGTTVLLLCNVTGNPEPSVTWTYDKQVNPNAHPRGSTLAISSVNEKNEGNYTCVANNTLGTKAGIVHLHVTEPVSVKAVPPIMVITPLKPLRLKCVGEGIPPPSVTLSKYGEDISADHSYRRINSAEILIMGITEANMLKYDGVYVCNATNGETSAKANQIVAINVTTPIDGQVPFNNISTTPLKAFHSQCPSGHTGPDGSPVAREFNLDEFICPSAREVGVIDSNPGPVTWLIRPDGKAQFLNGSANVDFGNVNSTAVITTPSTSLRSSATVTSTQSSLLTLPPLQPSTMSNIPNAGSLTTPLMVMTTSFVTHAPLNSIQTSTQLGHIISSYSSFDVTPTSQSQFLPPVASSRAALTMMATSSLSPSPAMTSLPSSVTSSPQASAGTYASSRGVSSSGMTSTSPSPSLAMTSLPSSVTSSSRVSVGSYSSSRGVSSSGMTSNSPTPSLKMATLPSSVTSSSHASVGTYASSRGVSSSGMTTSTSSPSMAMTSLPSSVTSPSQASAGTYASSRGVSSSGMTTSSSSSSLAMTSLPSSVTSPSQASTGTYASSRGVSSSGMTTSTSSPSMAMTSLPSSVTSPSQASAGTYASSRGVSSSGMTTSSSSSSLAMTSLPSSVTSSSQASTGTYASSRGVTSSGMTSSSPTPSMAMTSLPSSVASSSQASAGTYASSRGVSSSGMTSRSQSPSLTMTSFPSTVTSSSQASAGTYASSRGVSSSGMTSTSPSPSLAMTYLPSSVTSSSHASVGTYASSRGVSSSGMTSSSQSPSLAMTSLPSSVASSSQASAGTYASSRGVSSSGMTTSTSSPSMAMTYLPSSVTSSSHASVGTYASSRGVSSSGMTSSSQSPSLAMTSLPSSVASSSQASAGTYASSRGVSSSGMTTSTSSPSMAMTYLPSSITSSSHASAGTYASSRGVSSSGMTSSNQSPSLAMTSLPSSVTSSSQASAGTYASSRGVSSSGMTSTSPSPSMAMTSLPSSVTSSSQASAGTYTSARGKSSSGMTSSSPTPSMAMTSLPSSVTSSSRGSVGSYASSRGVSSSGMTSSMVGMTFRPSTMISSSEASAGTSASLRAVSSAPALEPSSTISSSKLRTGVSSSSVALPSLSPTFPMTVPAPSVTSAAYLLSSQSSLNKHISLHPTASLSGPTSFTPFLPTPTSSLTSLPVAVASITQTSITGLPSQIISPSSFALTTGQFTSRPGTYKQELTTEGTTATTTETRVAPHIPIPSQSVNAFTGKDVILLCNATGVPEPSVTWYYDKQNIFNANPDGNNLRLTYVTKDNNGDYTCVAENSVGQANGTVHVQTHEPLTISAKKPIVILEPDSFVNQLSCTANVDPTPKVTWSQYGGLDLSTDQTVVDLGDGDLILTGVTKANLEQYEGIYICQANNGLSSEKAYVVAAANISETLDSSKKFSDFTMKPGAALHATCVPGTVDADGSPLSTTFGRSDSTCDSARRVGVLTKDSGPITWFIRLDGKAEFVSETKGAALSMADALTTRDTPMSDPPSAATTIEAPLTCETCSGPACVLVPSKDTPCSIMTPFCMNTVIVKMDGSRIYTKSCASPGDCETKWWQQTSDEDRCTNMQQGNPYMEDFTCSYCCTTPGCNKDMFPKTDTLYKGNA